MTTENFKEGSLSSAIWPARRLSNAVHILAHKAAFISDEKSVPAFPKDHHDSPNDDLVSQWMDMAADALKIEIIAAESPYTELEEMLRRTGPAIIRLTDPDSPGFLAVLKGGRQKITLITPDFQVRRIPLNVIRDALTRTLEQAAAEPVRRILEEAGIPEERRENSQAAIVREQLSETRIRGCWLLRLSPGSDFRHQLRHARIPRYFATILGANFTGQALLVFSWWVIGRQSVQGHFEHAEMTAWALLLLTTIPFRLLDKWFQNLMSIDIGGLFKQRLLYGILQLEPEEIRHRGSGQFLGIVMEAESFGSLAMAGGMIALIAVIELFIVLAVLAFGAGGIFQVLLLSIWMALTVFICFKYYQRSQKWITGYREMTNDMVERMVGYRTRLIQEDSAHWHDEEDRILKDYVDLSKGMDRIGMVIKGIVGQGWLLVGLPGILFVFVTKSATSGEMAVSIGGVLLASQALSMFAAGVINVINVLVAWEQVEPLFHAAARPHQKASSGQPVLPVALDRAASSGQYPLLLARDLTFRYRKTGSPVLDSCNCQILQTDRVLLEGPSGGGKSTLSAVLTGLRFPESGGLLLWGKDRNAVSSDVWRSRVVTAPQFHENHVLTETFAFNLLMGRGWPPLQEDMAEAAVICRELGLGSLLERMPAEFQQMVGEGGWQLSHGERSRLFIARSLLQKADLIILDESFAALDPENLRRSLQCVLDRAPALIVIAHP